MDTIWEVNETIKSLLLNYPLFGEVLIAVERKIDNNIPTLAVTSDLCLLVNEEFWAGLDDEEHKGVMAHEVMHLMFGHFIRFKDYFEKHSTIVNTALDCAINQIILFKLPKGGITLDTVKNLTQNQKLKSKHTAEYYFNELMKVKKKLENDFVDSQDHSKQFENCENPLNNAKKEELIKKAIEAQKIFDRKHGVKSGDSLINLIPERVTTNQNVWKSLINKSMGDVPTNPEYIYGKQSRRNPDVFFGKRMTMENPHVWVIIDTSMSVSNQELTKFIGHINSAIRKFDVTTTLIECDSSIKKITNIKRKIKQIDIHGRGGTNLYKAIEHIIDQVGNSKTKIVMMTDGHTDWHKIPSNMEITAIYTHKHVDLDGIKCSAVLT
jgi:predicted metal-dependent peptidase